MEGKTGKRQASNGGGQSFLGYLFGSGCTEEAGQEQVNVLKQAAAKPLMVSGTRDLSSARETDTEREKRERDVCVLNVPDFETACALADRSRPDFSGARRERVQGGRAAQEDAPQGS